jgi:enoyl-CoA hydratase/carnithine racemase
VNAVAPLRIVECDRVVYVHVMYPSPPGVPASRVAEGLFDTCSEIRDRLHLPAALAIVSAGRSFCIDPPASRNDCDQAAAVWREAIEAVAELAVPTVAGIAGNAIGTSWELALACDIRLAEHHIKLGSPEIGHDRMPACGGTQRLTRLVGPGRALEMLLLGDLVDADTALERGLVHRLTQTSGIEAALEEILGALRSAAPIALAYAKEAVHRGVNQPMADGLRLEADLATLLQTTRDRAEGLASFLERRQPNFEGH